MQAIINACVAMANWFWGLPILILVVGGGLYLSVRCGFVQVTKIGYIFSQTFGKMFQKSEDGNISSFAAACTALGSSIGASNIVGVPVAIAMGGPGAVFWMWIIAVVGCCTKYCEIALAVKYKVKDESGNWFGGAFSYIKEAFGTAFGTFGEIFVTVCVLLFVITTITVVIYYGEKNMQFVFKTEKAGLIWRFVILAGMIFALFGIELTIAYQLTDFFGALKIIPNMLALIWLAPQVVALNKEFYHTPGKYYMADMEAKQEKKAAKHSA